MIVFGYTPITFLLSVDLKSSSNVHTVLLMGPVGLPAEVLIFRLSVPRFFRCLSTVPRELGSRHPSTSLGGGGLLMSEHCSWGETLRSLSILSAERQQPELSEVQVCFWELE
jgi:hypothetical protein